MADEKNTAPVSEDEMKEYKVVEEPQSEQEVFQETFNDTSPWSYMWEMGNMYSGKCEISQDYVWGPFHGRVRWYSN